MKKIIIYDIAASSGGALSVLTDHYNRYKVDENSTTQYFFIVSSPQLKETNKIKVMSYPWIKRSWLHRLYFDYMVAPKLVKSIKPDSILSLQNTIIPRVKDVFQTLYFHNMLFLSSVKFGIIKHPKLWVYQNVIKRLVFKSMKEADAIIVQAEWIKTICMNKLKIDESKISVKYPKIEMIVDKRYEQSDKIPHFLYPASAVVFKNHNVIFEAFYLLHRKGISNYKLVLTICGNETKEIKKWRKVIKDNNMPIELVGFVSREEIIRYYQKSILIFSSFLESSPLPLTEASLHNCPIISSDYPFSREILENYENVQYFNAFDAVELHECLLKFIK